MRAFECLACVWTPSLAPLLATLWLAADCQAQPSPRTLPQAASTTAAGAAGAASAPAPARKPGTNSRTTVIEDEAVRIEETRLRGQPQRITVHSKVPGAKDYEILVTPGSSGKDPSQDRGATGQRAWSLFAF